MSAPPDLVSFCTEQHPRLVGMLGLYCGDRAVAEEISQEALMKACRQWHSLSAKQDPEAWITRVAFNLTNSYYRRKRAEYRARDRFRSRVITESESDPSLAISLRRALAALPRRQRTVLILHYYLDLPFPEVAAFMDIPVSTAKSLSGRAVARLRTSPDLSELKEALNAC